MHFFHLLVHEATARLVSVAFFAAKGSHGLRSQNHEDGMPRLCQADVEYRQVHQIPAGQVVPHGIRDIASEFVFLQQARHQADYDTAMTITHAQADTDVMRAETAFLDWTAVNADLAADAFLAELFCRGIPKR